MFVLQCNYPIILILECRKCRITLESCKIAVNHTTMRFWLKFKLQQILPNVFCFFMLHFCNSCQLRLRLRLSCDYLSTNSIPRCTTVGYHIIFVPLFTQTFLWDSPSYSQVLPYVTTIWSSSVDINSDSLLYISTLDFAFQGTGMHGTIFTIYHMFIPCLRNSL